MKDLISIDDININQIDEIHRLANHYFLNPNLHCNDLKEKISEILKNYDRYQPMIDSAYNKIITKWSTANFFNQFLKNT